MTQQTFKETVFCLKDEMYRFAKRFVLSSDEAQDIVQDLMLKFWQKKEELSQLTSLKSYVLRAVKNECLNRLKHHDIKLGFASLHKSQLHHYYTEANNLREHILGFINQLPEKQRAVIHLKDVEEMDVPEIAAILDMEANAVRSNLMRARPKVNLQIEQLMHFENRAVAHL